MMLPWLRRDYYTFEVMVDKPRWIEWGYLYRERGGDAYAWFIKILLPSYSMQVAPWRDGPPTWHQAHLIYKNTLAGKPMKDGGWKIMDFECYEQPEPQPDTEK